LVDIFPLDPDPGSQNVEDPTDPDPKHCIYVLMLNHLRLHESILILIVSNYLMKLVKNLILFLEEVKPIQWDP